MITGPSLLLLILASILVIIVLTAKFKLHPFLALIVACFFLGITVGIPLPEIVKSMEKGFGGIMSYIGMIVVFGSVIGVFLEKSGGALKIAQSIIKLTGQKKTISAISLIGAVVSIPVFCDSGFILLSGLADKISKLSNTNKASLSLSLATGLYTTHTLVPPTPGPIAAAGNIGASGYLGTMILIGLCFSIPVLLMTQFLSKKLGKSIVANEKHSVEEKKQNDSIKIPSLRNSIIPLLVPIILIAVGTILRFIGVAYEWINFISAPVVAIFIGALLAMFLLRPKSKDNIKGWFAEAVKVSGPILIITAAGGAFGGVLKTTPLAEYVGQWMTSGESDDILILLLIFLIAAVLKSAQGSSTSAMVITSSLLAPLIPALGWDSAIQFSLAVLVIGGGAMTVSHFNDSYFWVVSQFSGMSAKDTNRTFTLITGIQGVTVLLLSVLGWVIFV
ncbi:GntP family permease [Aquimarina gracilis]|uniref:GntP family permease n=1 Tax=Aquimarina gracilis TaxID=874422 RepID=A0ABU5ZWR0_9FLAO|nr:GntP family permease [Aquimarina gracilis]MEB3346296.1 GntP family permease [Aquimarina gracilis]